MRIIDVKNRKVYYDTKGADYFVTAEFWKALKTGKIKYRTGGERDGILYTEILVLKMSNKNFEKVFKSIALSSNGEAMLAGKLPVTDTL